MQTTAASKCSLSLSQPNCIAWTHFACLSCRSFLQALLPQLRKLAPLLRIGNTGKELFLRVLGRLLALSARTLLSPAQPAFEFVLDSYVTLLSTK